jgi:hypothetical protein
VQDEEGVGEGREEHWKSSILMRVVVTGSTVGGGESWWESMSGVRVGVNDGMAWIWSAPMV